MALPDFTADEKFERDRRANDQRLKSRFEHIFSKYEYDFTGIGDEIDLTTGEIVVDNGHIASLQFGVDIGSKAASTFIDSFAHEHAEESGDNTPDLQEDDDDDTPDIVGDDEDEGFDFRQSLDTLAQDNHDPSDSSDYSSSGVLTDDEDAADDFQGPTTPHIVRESSQPPQSQIRALQNIPGVIRDTIEAMKSKHGPYDQASLDRFENNIAGEIARFLAISQPTAPIQERNPARDPRWDYPELPVQKRQRSESPTGLTSRPALSSSAALFTQTPKASASLWAADGSRASKRQRSSSSGAADADEGISNAQAKFMSVVRAHATSSHGLMTPQPPAAPQPDKYMNVANTGRRILPKPDGGPTIDQQRIEAERQRLLKQQSWRPWRSSGRIHWADDVPSFRNEREEFRPLASKTMILPRPPIKIKGSKPEPKPYTGPVSDIVAMQLLQRKHVHRLAEKRYRVAHVPVEDDYIGGPRPFYTVEEDALLLKMRHEQGLDWDVIMKKMPNRTQVSLYNRFSYIRRLMLPDIMPQASTKADLPLISSEEAIAQLTKSGPMPERIEFLRSLFNQTEDGRTRLEEADLNAMPVPEYREQLRRNAGKQTGAFLEREDRLIARLRDREHMLFEEMVPHLPGRSAQQIAERYYDYILGRPMPQEDTDQEEQDAGLESMGSPAPMDSAPALADTTPATTAPFLSSRPALPITASLITPTQARLIPRPSRFSGTGRNPFMRPATSLPPAPRRSLPEPLKVMAKATSGTAMPVVGGSRCPPSFRREDKVALAGSTAGPLESTPVYSMQPWQRNQMQSTARFHASVLPTSSLLPQMTGRAASGAPPHLSPSPISALSSQAKDVTDVVPLRAPDAIALPAPNEFSQMQLQQLDALSPSPPVPATPILSPPRSLSGSTEGTTEPASLATCPSPPQNASLATAYKTVETAQAMILKLRQSLGLPLKQLLATQEKPTGVVKVVAEPERLLQRRPIRPKQRKSLPARIEMHSRPSTPDTPPSPDKLQQDERSMMKAVSTKPAMARRHPSPDLLQENRRSSMPARFVVKSSSTISQPLKVRAPNATKPSIPMQDLSEDELA